MKWSLRIDNGSVFDAPDLDVLRRWAAEGRVSPGSDVSRNGGEWQPAPSVPELEMIWMVRLREGGEFGPVHIGAVLDLMADGLVAPDEPLENKRTGESVPLRRWMTDWVHTGMETPAPLTAADAEEIETLRAELQRTTEALRKTRDEARDLERRLTTMSSESAARENQAVRDAVSACERQWLKERKTVEEEAARRERKIVDLTAEGQRLRKTLAQRDREQVALQRQGQQERAASETLVAELNRRVSALTGDCSSLRETLSARDRDYSVSEQQWLRERVSFEERIAALEQRLAARTKEHDELRKTLSGRDREHAALMKQWGREKTVLQEQVSELEQRLEPLRAERNEIRETLTGRDRDYAASEQRWLCERTAFAERVSDLEQQLATLTVKRAASPDPESGTGTGKTPSAGGPPPATRAPDAGEPPPPPRWWACNDGKQRPGAAVILEPEIVRAPMDGDGHTPRKTDGNGTMDNLRRLESQAQAELARWQSRKRKAANSVGTLRQWFTRKGDP